MQQETSGIQPVELTREIEKLGWVCFDQSRVCLTGRYTDELSIFRAKRIWTEVLADNFLLEPGYDFGFSYVSCAAESSFVLNCEFLTACGRYAFWRLTNNQAPEAQFTIETAHIPNAELRQSDFIRTPDLCEAPEPSIYQSQFQELQSQPLHWTEGSIGAVLKRLLASLRTSLRL